VAVFAFSSQVAGEFLTGELDIALVRDVVTVEHAPRFVAAYAHGLSFRNTCANPAYRQGFRTEAAEPSLWR